MENREWISLLERVPQDGVGVLIALNTGYITVGYRTLKLDGKSYNWQMFGDNDAIGVDAERDYVTHWMPLPKPPVPPKNIDRKIYQYPRKYQTSTK